jgi:hypothetical protein
MLLLLAGAAVGQIAPDILAWFAQGSSAAEADSSSQALSTLALVSLAVSMISALGSVAAASASFISARASRRAAETMKQDMSLRQRPYMLVERPTAELNDKGELMVKFFMRNNGALPAKVLAHVRLTISDDESTSSAPDRGDRTAVVSHEDHSFIAFSQQEHSGLYRINKADADCLLAEKKVHDLIINFDYSAIGYPGQREREYFSNTIYRLGVHGSELRYVHTAGDAN